MIDPHDLAVMFALRAEGAKFAGVLDDGASELTREVMGEMESHEDYAYYQVIQAFTDKAIDDNKDIWEQMPYFMLPDVSKWIVPDFDVESNAFEVATRFGRLSNGTRGLLGAWGADEQAEDTIMMAIDVVKDQLQYSEYEVEQRVREALRYDEEYFEKADGTWVEMGLAEQLSSSYRGQQWLHLIKNSREG